VLNFSFCFLSSHHLKPPAESHGVGIFFFFFSFHHHHQQRATASHLFRRDPRLFSQIWTHRGQPPPRRDPRHGSLLRSVQTEASHHHAAKHEPPRREARTTLPCRSQRSGGGGAFRSPRWFLVAKIWWFLVAEIWWFWLLRFPVVVVVAGGKELFVSLLFLVGNNDKGE
jgi:hypothetical protein